MKDNGLNKHYLSECPQKKQFKQCPRCKEAVLLKDYDASVESYINWKDGIVVNGDYTLSFSDVPTNVVIFNCEVKGSYNITPLLLIPIGFEFAQDLSLIYPSNLLPHIWYYPMLPTGKI